MADLRTKDCMPEGMQLTKPDALAVAILKPDLKPEGAKSEEDYLWIKCLGKTTASKIHQQCELRTSSQGDFVLKHGLRMLAHQTPMSEIVNPHDRLVVLEQVGRSEYYARLALAEGRQPLQPVDHHQALINAKNAALQHLEKGRPGTFRAPRPEMSGSQDENRDLGNNRYSHPINTPPPSDLIEQTQQARDMTRRGAKPARSAARVTASPSFGVLIPTSYIPQNDGIYSSPPAPDAASKRHLVQGSAETYERSLEQKENEVKADIRKELDNPAHDTSLSQASVQEESQQSFQIHSLLKDAEPEVLEASVDQGVKLLQKLKAPLQTKAPESSDALQWMQQIDNLQKQAARTKTIIGVVGNTGAGKSSVINAMLDEERLVPTNCMRACTAVVTEISWNDEEQPYRAEIEFITLDDWRKELEILFNDLIDMNGAVSRESSNEDSDAGVAYAKIKAVYPRKTKEDMANSSIDSMLREVSSLLGTTRNIDENESSRFYTRLQHYVDSKEKATGEKKDKKKERREMEFWPLIRVVRIYVKSPALSTGAVIVDLPGVHDSNAARAAVAEGYMKRCTGLWIVAPINRAVDDRAAKNLLGESFKRQLKMDGGFNAVTFICSKTDDISLLEAQDSLDLGDELGPQWAEIERLGKSIKDLKRRLEDLKESKSVYTEIMDDADDQLEVWDKLKDELEEGKTVYAPKLGSSGKKRKARGTDRPRKKRRAGSDSDNDESEDGDYQDEETDDEAESTNENEEPLTEDQVSAKISEIKANKKKARQEKAELDSKIKTLASEIKTSQAEEKRVEADIAAKCIAGRNKYSKGAIQQDFAAGIKELDQELAAEDDEENFNPDVDARDYDEVARSLKCFCVSSRAYQKLSGRLRKDPSVPGFQSIEETEMPQLQAHCKELTKEGRSANCRRFINNLSQLLNSLALWCSNDGTGQNLTAEQREKEATLLSSNLKKLEDGLDKIVVTTCEELSEEFGDNIFDRFETAVNNAVEEASRTVDQWGAPVNRDNRALGGLYWATYKAICRRDGVYANAQGPHEWNVQLAEPMMKILSPGWEKMFTRRTPMVMASFVRNATELVKHFHRDVNSRARKIGLGIAGLQALKQQLAVYENILKDVSREAAETVNNRQKEINREFVPVIQSAMADGYSNTLNETGPGCYKRMKAVMSLHVEQQRPTMFQQSVNEVRQQLKTLKKDVEAKMNEKTDEVFISMQRDYRSVLGGGAPEGQLLSKSERLMRKKVLRIIEGVETVFRKIASGELVESEEEEEEEPEDGDSDRLDFKREPRLEAEAQIKPEPREDDSSSKEVNPSSSIFKPSQAVKPEAQHDHSMSGAPEPPDDLSAEAALPSLAAVMETSSPRQNHETSSRTKRETPDALDAQLNESGSISEQSESSSEEEYEASSVSEDSE
ncbi:MAG: hypothetical protein Q9201_005409 [Fulgogasparrea decipioides]